MVVSRLSRWERINLMARKIFKQRRQNPIIFLGVEGKNKTEYNYFKNFHSRNYKIRFSKTGCTDIDSMAEDLYKLMIEHDFNTENGDKAFLVVDTDDKRSRIEEIKKKLSFCEKNHIEVIASSPEIEVWFLFHYIDKNIPNSKKDIKRELGKYIGKKYKKSDDIYSSLKPLTDKAIQNSKKYESRLGPEKTLSFCPRTEVYKIVEYIKSLSNE